jgi:hypothetical protein
MGSLSFDDLQMFFSLLFLPQIEGVSSLSAGLNCSSVIEEVTLGGYDFAYDKSLFELLGASCLSSDFATISTIGSSDQGLLDWCSKNEYEDLSLLFPAGFALSTSAVSFSDWFDIFVPNNDTLFLVQHNVDSLVSNSSFSSSDSFWSILQMSDKNQLSVNLLLLKSMLCS